MIEWERTERGKDRHRRESVEAIGKSKGKRNMFKKKGGLLQREENLKFEERIEISHDELWVTQE